MTTRPVRGVEIAEVDEEAVASYLSATPEFFDRHAQLLARIRLPDTRSGASTVSLVERQVEVLRERNRQLERKVKDFVDVARENDVLGIARACDGAPADRSKGRRCRDRRNRVARSGRNSTRASRSSCSPPSRAPQGIAEGRFLRVVPAEAPGIALFRDAFQLRQAALRAAARFPARVPVRRRRAGSGFGRARAARQQGQHRPPGLRIERQPPLQSNDEH